MAFKKDYTNLCMHLKKCEITKPVLSPAFQ